MPYSMDWWHAIVKSQKQRSYLVKNKAQILEIIRESFWSLPTEKEILGQPQDLFHIS